MHFLRHISIRSKQTWIMMLTSSAALLMACAAFVAYEMISFRGALVKEIDVLAEIVGSNCAAAIDFDDPRSAAETLSALRANEHILAAAVYTGDGQLFARYRREDAVHAPPPVSRAIGYEFVENRLELFGPIIHHGEVIGMIYVASDLNLLATRVARYLGIGGLVFLASAGLAFVLSRYLQQLISRPILHLAGVVRRVGQEKDYSVRAVKTGEDELGQLMDGFNEMLDQIQLRDNALKEARNNLEKRVADRTRELESIHRQLVDASRLSGMAEIATNVLHNVGNVLNSVNISASLVGDRVKNSKAASLSKVVDLLKEHQDDLGSFITEHPRGKHLPAFLTQLAELVRVEHEATAKELASLCSNIEHIKEIVATQQNYTRASGLRETVDLAALIEDSLRMNAGALNRHNVEVVREIGEVSPVVTQKHKIMQILVNLVRNAKYACDESGRTDKRLTIRVKEEGDRISISVIDNGIGIPKENMTRIFNHGFTTRKEGNGFGLHSSALAAKDLGGALRVQSDGLGQGATFTLEIPVVREGAVA